MIGAFIALVAGIFGVVSVFFIFKHSDGEDGIFAGLFVFVLSIGLICGSLWEGNWSSVRTEYVRPTHVFIGERFTTFHSAEFEPISKQEKEFSTTNVYLKVRVSKNAFGERNVVSKEIITDFAYSNDMKNVERD